MNKEELLKKIEETFYLQDHYNSLINKEWFKERDLAVDWINALLDESSEFLNSFNWKWWKDIEGKKLYSFKDKNNVLIELVDMYHFIISFLIQISKVFFSNKVEDKKYGLLKKLRLNSDFSDLYLSKIFGLFTLDRKKERFSEKEIFILLQNFLKEVIETLYDLEEIIRLLSKKKDYKKPNNNFDSLIEFYSGLLTLNKEKFLEKILFKKAIEHFLDLLQVSGFSIEDLIKFYIGKVFLNEYRQIKGYKEGKYKKIWKNGKEDNENLFEIIKKLKIEDLKKERLFEEFDKRY